ncbi:cob(I)yrinic acid a,c-diamide adenosyltransferase [Patescibacteria group bacterium]
MLYTRKGDDGKTIGFGCDQRFSKSSAIAEALGSLDEINSFLGICKLKVQSIDFKISDKKPLDLLEKIQQNLFIIQAQVAGADKKIEEIEIKEIENIIDEIEKELPTIKNFFISGGTEQASHLDFARTISRRAERRVVKVKEENEIIIDDLTLVYLNRLSSFLYAIARFFNHKYGINEESPKY